MTPTTPTLLATAVTLLALAVPAQGERGDDDHDGKPAATKKLEEWPPLERADRDRLLGCLAQFRKENEELHESARAQLIRVGEAGMPLLFQKVSDQQQSINAHLFLVFDAVLTERHAALIAREAQKPKVELRRYLMQRLCRFFDPDMRPVLAAAAKDSDPRTAYYAALGALALGDREALPTVLAFSKTNWATVGEVTGEVLSKARSNRYGSWVFEAIAKAPAADQMAGLRLARYLAVKDHNVILRGYLQAADHAVKKEAVNALRVMNGEEPLEKLSVFQAIEMAKQWLNKI